MVWPDFTSAPVPSMRFWLTRVVGAAVFGTVIVGPVVGSNATVGWPSTGATAPSACLSTLPMATMSATTTRLSVAPIPASVRPLAPNASLGGMAKRMREPALTPVSG